MLRGDFLKVLENAFTSFDIFKEEFSKKAIAVQGSGWAWLGYNKLYKTLEVTTTQNHETISSYGLIPLLIVDVWEHAYYLQYRNERNTFIKEIFKILNWEEVEKRYKKAID